MSRTRTVAALATGSALALGATAAAASGPTISSLSVKQSGNAVTVSITKTNFTIDMKDVGKKNVAGKGHEHFTVKCKGKDYDFPKYSGANGKLAKTLGVQGKYSPSLTDKVTYTGLPKGTCKATVHLVNNDHSNYKNASSTKTKTFSVK